MFKHTNIIVMNRKIWKLVTFNNMLQYLKIKCTCVKRLWLEQYIQWLTLNGKYSRQAWNDFLFSFRDGEIATNKKNSYVHWIKRMLALRSLASSTPTMFLFCTRYCYSDDDLSSYTGLVRLAFLFLSSLWWWRSLRMCTSDPRLFSVIVEITEFLVMPLELVEIRFLRNMLLMRYFTPLLKLSFNPPYRTGFKALLVYNNVTAAK